MCKTWKHIYDWKKILHLYYIYNTFILKLQYVCCNVHFLDVVKLQYLCSNFTTLYFKDTFSCIVKLIAF